MTRRTDDSSTLLGLMWLASPALPVGGFSYSEGLEAAVDAGVVTDAERVSQWLLDQLELVVCRCEWPALRWAHIAWSEGALDAVRQANDWVLQTRETRELRLQSEQMGRSLADWVGRRFPPDDERVAALRALPGGPTWPVAFALAACAQGADDRQTLLAHGFAWAENQVQAAIKCVPLGQSAGQSILQQLVRALPEAVDRTLARPVGQGTAFAPGLAIFSARHEEQYSRLFRS